MSDRNIQIAFTVQDETAAGLASVQRTVTGATQAIEAGGEKAATGIRKIEGAAEAAGQAVRGIGTDAQVTARQTEQSVQRMNAATRSMISQIQRQEAAAIAGSATGPEFFRELAARRGNLQPELLEPHIRALERARGQTDLLNNSTQRLGLTAKQTGLAMQQVPMQLTDIFVSLQGGMDPMMVALQQGGQLKDLFGGIGNAVLAMGSYIKTLLTPLNVAIAAALGAVVAFEMAGRQAEQMGRALVISGNQAGVTMSQVREMAESIAEETGTVGRAQAALNALVREGVKSENLREAGEAAMRWARLTGQSVEEVAKQFGDLQRDPVRAVLSLNESMNFLTPSILEQIRALEQQGRTTDAARVAFEALTQSISERASDARTNVQGIGDGFGWVISQIRTSFDKLVQLMALLRGYAPLSAQIAEIDRRLAPLIARQDRRQQAGLGQLWTDNRKREQLSAERDRLQLLLDEENRKAAAKRAQAEGLAASERVRAFAQRHRTVQQQIEQAKTEIEAFRRYAALAGTPQAEVDRIAAAHLAQATARNTPRTAAARVDPRIAERQRELREEENIMARLAGVNADYHEQLMRIQRLRDSGRVSEAESIRLLNELIERQPMAAQLMRERERALQSVNREQERAEQLALREATAVQQQVQQVREETEELGLTRYVLHSVRQARLDDAIATAKQAEASAILRGASNAEIAALWDKIDALKALKAANQGRFDRETEIERNAEIKRQAEQAEEDWKRTAQGIENSLTDALMRGFESGKGFLQNLRDVIVNTFKTMVLQPTVRMVFAPLSAGIAAGMGGPALAGQAGGAAGFGGGSGMLSSLGLLSGAFGTGLGSGVASIMGGGLGGWLSAGTSLIGTGTAAGIGAGAGLLAGPIGLALGALTLLGGGRIFGRGPRQVTGSGLEGIFGTGGADLRQFETWSQRGSLFRRGRSGTDTSPISAELDATLDNALRSVTQSVRDHAQVLGLNASAIDGVTQSIRLSTAGLNEQQTREAIEGAVAGFGDELAKRLVGHMETYTVEVGGLFRRLTDDAESGMYEWAVELETRTRWVQGEFARQGETASQTLQRLASSLAVVNQVADTLYGTMMQASIASGHLASQIVDAFGGVEQFVSATSAYHQAFYTEAERNATTTRQLTTALQGMGLALPDTLAGFRALVDAQDLTTEAGRKTFAALINLAPAFAQVTNAATAAAEEAARAAAALLASFDAVKQAADLLYGYTLKASDDAKRFAEQMVSAFGTIEQFVTATSAYHQAFYTEAERNATTTRQLTTALQGMGLALPDTLAGFRALVDAQDLTTEAGRKTFAALINLAPAFAQVTNAATAAAEEAARVAERAAEEAARALRTQMDSLAGAFGAYQDAQRRVLEGQIDQAELGIKAIDEQLRGVNELLKAAHGLGQYAQRLRAEFAGAFDEAASLELLRADLASALGAARGGDVDAFARVQSGAQDFLAAAREQAATPQEFARLAAGVILDVEDVARSVEGAQQSAAQALQSQRDALAAQQQTLRQQLDVLTKGALTAEQALAQAREQFAQDASLMAQQLIATDGIANGLAMLPPEVAAALSSVLLPTLQQMASGFASTLALRDSTAAERAAQAAAGGQISIAQARDQLAKQAIREAAGGSLLDQTLVLDRLIDGAGYTVQRVQELATTALGAAVNLDTLNTAKKINDLYERHLGRVADAGGLQFWLDAALHSGGLDVVKSGIFQSDEFRALGRSIPHFAKGTNRVPADMLAVVHEGERIIPAADNKQLLRLTAEGQREAGEMRALSGKVQALGDALRAIAHHTERTARVLMRVAPEGDALLTRAAMP